MTPRKLPAMVAVLALGCGYARPDASSADSPSVATTRVAGDTPPASGIGAPKAAGPRTGLWALCSVEKRLTQAGFVVNHATEPSPRRAGFSVAPATYSLGRSRLA